MHAPPETPASEESAREPAAGLSELEALERELDRVFVRASPARGRLQGPLTAVRSALAALTGAPAAGSELEAALDDLEDAVEAMLRAEGWPVERKG